MKIIKCDRCGKGEEFRADIPNPNKCSEFIFRNFADISTDLCSSCENEIEIIITDFLENKGGDVKDEE